VSDRPLTREQLDALIDQRAGVVAAQMIGQALHGAAERVAAAITGGPVVVLPVLHMADIVAEATALSPGMDTYVSGGVSR
jgi:hypothetical protein